MHQTASEPGLGAGRGVGDITPWAACHIPRERRGVSDFQPRPQLCAQPLLAPTIWSLSQPAWLPLF